MGDIVYVNVELNQSTGEFPQPLAGTINYTSPIVDRAGDYYAAVARLTAPLNLPYWLPEMQLSGDPANVENTIYHVAIAMEQSPVPANPGDPYVWTPYVQASANLKLSGINRPPNSQPQNLENAIYNIADITVMFNNALKVAFDRVCTLIRNDTHHRVLKSTYNPVMVYDKERDAFNVFLWPAQLYTSAGISIDSLVPANSLFVRATIYFSATLKNYVESLPTTILNSKPSQSVANGFKDIRLNTENYGNNYFSTSTNDAKEFTTIENFESFGFSATTSIFNIPAVVPNAGNADFAGGVVLVVYNQTQGSFTDSFNAVNSIRVLSSGLLQSNEIGAVNNAIANPNRGGGGMTSNAAPILQDFIPDHAPGWNRRMLIYTADSIVTGARYVELNGNSNISRFSISLEWLDVWGVVHPLYSSSVTNNSSIKLAFVKKSLFRR